jgi:hypothetical protein
MHLFKETHANKCSGYKIILPSNNDEELKPLFPKLFNVISARRRIGYYQYWNRKASMDDVFCPVRQFVL